MVILIHWDVIEDRRISICADGWNIYTSNIYMDEDHATSSVTGNARESGLTCYDLGKTYLALHYLDNRTFGQKTIILVPAPQRVLSVIRFLFPLDDYQSTVAFLPQALPALSPSIELHWGYLFHDLAGFCDVKISGGAAAPEK